jgi:transposase InsO family protein
LGWVADFIYIATQEGWLYMAAILDLFSRRIVGLAMSDHMTDGLGIAALQQTLTHRAPTGSLTHHSDRGSQYTSKDFRELLKNIALLPARVVWAIVMIIHIQVRIQTLNNELRQSFCRWYPNMEKEHEAVLLLAA